MNKLIIFFILSGFVLFSCRGQENKKTESKAPQKQTVESLSKQIAKNPSDASLYIERAKLYQKNTKTNDAIADVQKAINLQPDSSSYYLLLADYYMQLGQLKNTIGVLQKVLQMEPENTDALLKMAEINLMIKNYKEVFAYSTKALNADPYNARAFFIRGFAYKEMGDTAKAVENFMETVKNDPKHYNALTELGLIYSTRKDERALDYFDNAIAADSTKELAYYYKAMYYQNNDYLNEALDIYRMMMNRFPKFPYAYYNTGYIYLELLKVPDEAVPYFTQAIQANPGYYEAYFNRGLCFEILGDVIKAQNDYQTALKIKPGYAKAIEGLKRVKEIMSR